MLIIRKILDEMKLSRPCRIMRENIKIMLRGSHLGGGSFLLKTLKEEDLLDSRFYYFIILEEDSLTRYSFSIALAMD